MLVCCLSVYVQAQVWTLKEKEPAAPGTWWCFRNTVTLDEQPRSLELRLAADTKYWLWVNDELQVSEGGYETRSEPFGHLLRCDNFTSRLACGREYRSLAGVVLWARMVSAIAIPLRQASVSPFLATARRWNPMQNGG